MLLLLWSLVGLLPPIETVTSTAYSREANFSVFCANQSTCYEFEKCCRWFMDGACGRRTPSNVRSIDCQTGINGKPVRRTLKCSCQESVDWNWKTALRNLEMRTLLQPPKDYRSVVHACRTMMSTLGGSDPCGVFGHCCDTLLAGCRRSDGRTSRKILFCSPKWPRDSFCECSGSDREYSLADLRAPGNGVGVLTQTCAFVSETCRDFSNCCRAYLRYCPNDGDVSCQERSDGRTLDKNSLLCHCNFSLASRPTVAGGGPAPANLAVWTLLFYLTFRLSGDVG